MKLHTTKYIKFPSGFWSGLQQLGIAPRDVARQAGLPLTVITEPKVTAAEYFAIWQAFSDLIGILPKRSLDLYLSLNRHNSRLTSWPLTTPVIIGMLFAAWPGINKCVP